MDCSRVVTLAVLCALSAHPQPATIQRFDDLIKAGKYADAAPLLEDYTSHNPESAQAWYQVGYVYFRLHKIWPSVKALSRSLAIDPSQAEAHKILGHDFLILGRLDLAADELRRATKLDPKSVEAHYGLGRVHYENGDYGLAREHLAKTVELDPRYVKGWHNLGLALEAMGSLEHARSCFVRAIELSQAAAKQSEWPYLNFAGFLNRLAQPEQALELLGKAELINPAADQVHFEKAKAYRALQQWEAAIASVQRAINLNNCNAEHHYVLSLLLRKVGRTKQADQAVGRFRQMQSDNSTGHTCPTAQDLD